MQLAQAMSQIAKQEAAFTSAVEIFRGITAESVDDLQRQIDVKQLEFDEMRADQEQALKRRKIESDIDLEQHRRSGARAILQEFNEVPIAENELTDLREQLAATRKELEHTKNAFDERLQLELNNLENRLKREHEASKAAIIKHKELEHKANVADLEANASQASKEVATLKSTIAELREEVREQRKLTQSVAEASKQGAIQQTFGKS